MLRSKVLHIIAVMLAVLVFAPAASAQFKEEAFQNGFGNEEGMDEKADSAKAMFSVKEYMAGLMHKQELKIGTMAAGSAIFVGGNQIYNKQYWKLPAVYGSLAATAGGGLYYRNRYNATQDEKYRKISTCCFVGTALSYWGTMMDGVVSYKTDVEHHAGKATLYSLLLPGLGQAYNGEFWKIPIYIGAISTSVAFYTNNTVNYNRFRRIYNEATAEGSSYNESISAETALYYRNIYRRYRDYSVLAIAACYLLQAIDANVFSYMQDFEVNDDISMEVRPAVITPDTQWAYSGGSSNAFGFSIGFRF